MTDKKLKVSNLAFTELSIKIATLDMKLNKVLELLNKPEVTIVNSFEGGCTEAQIKEYQQNVQQFVETFSIDKQFSENFK